MWRGARQLFSLAAPARRDVRIGRHFVNGGATESCVWRCAPLRATVGCDMDARVVGALPLTSVFANGFAMTSSRAGGNKQVFKEGTEAMGEAAKDGNAEATKDGNAEAAKEGNTEATKDGNAEAAKEGSAKAAKDGNAEAAKEGNTEAAKDGNAKAAKDGNAEATKDGNTEAAKDGNTDAAKDGNTEAAKEGNADAAKEGNADAAKDGNTDAAKSTSGAGLLVPIEKSRLAGGAKNLVILAGLAASIVGLVPPDIGPESGEPDLGTWETLAIGAASGILWESENQEPELGERLGQWSKFWEYALLVRNAVSVWRLDSVFTRSLEEVRAVEAAKLGAATDADINACFGAHRDHKSMIDKYDPEKLMEGIVAMEERMKTSADITRWLDNGGSVDLLVKYGTALADLGYYDRAAHVLRHVVQMESKGTWGSKTRKPTHDTVDDTVLWAAMMHYARSRTRVLRRDAHWEALPKEIEWMQDVWSWWKDKGEKEQDGVSKERAAHFGIYLADAELSFMVYKNSKTDNTTPETMAELREKAEKLSQKYIGSFGSASYRPLVFGAIVCDRVFLDEIKGKRGCDAPKECAACREGVTRAFASFVENHGKDSFEAQAGLALTFRKLAEAQAKVGDNVDALHHATLAIRHINAALKAKKEKAASQAKDDERSLSLRPGIRWKQEKARAEILYQAGHTQVALWHLLRLDVGKLSALDKKERYSLILKWTRQPRFA